MLPASPDLVIDIGGEWLLARAAAVVAAASMMVGCGSTRPAREGDGACGTRAPSYATVSLERWFRLHWRVTQGRKGPELQGYVYNDHAEPADHMMLAVERLDASGRVVGCSTLWIGGSIPPSSRAYFDVRLPEASATYRVRILSFDWLHGPGSGGM